MEYPLLKREQNMLTLATVWLLCFALFLEMACRAPVIEDWFD
jgi:hypothetical protein